MFHTSRVPSECRECRELFQTNHAIFLPRSVHAIFRFFRLFSDNRKAVIEARFSVSGNHAGMRIEAWLALRIPLLSATKLRVLLANGSVLRNGHQAVAGHRLRAGDAVHVCWEPALLPPLPPEPRPLSVVWEHGSLVAIDKPAGMLMHPTRGVKRGTLAGALLGNWNPWLREDTFLNDAATPVVWPHFVHRLDRETSGLVLVARDPDTASQMGKLWAQREVRKFYAAILEGEMPTGGRVVDAPIGRVSEVAPHWQVTPTGASAQSRFVVVASHAGRSLAILSPLTGRTNQLRVHAASNGHPIAGDTPYGAASAARLFLHAWRLILPYPSEAKPLLLEAPLPEAFRDAWPKCRILLEKAVAQFQELVP